MQFAFNILTRSRRITYDNLRLRDPEFIAGWTSGSPSSAEAGHGTGETCPPMFPPFRLGELELANRVVVSPMDMYVAHDGMPGEFHFVHLGGKALGGAGLVMTEMVCVSPRGRITPGCTGLWSDEHGAAWKRICDFVHASSTARIGIQLGHCGPQGLHQAHVGGHRPAAAEGTGRWSRASPLPYKAGVNQTPRDWTEPAWTPWSADFVSAAQRADGGRLRPAGAALRARLPAVGIPVPGDQPAH